MKKVLMVMDNLYKDSGVVAIIMSLFSHIDKDKVAIDFLVFQDNNSDRVKNNSCVGMVEQEGSKVYVLKNPLAVKTLFPACIEIRDFFRNHANEYDIVHLNSPTMSEFTLRYAKKYNIKHRIIHSHSTMTSPNAIKKTINVFLQRNVTKYANHFWACSTEAAVFLYGTEFCQSNEIELIKNAVEPEQFRVDYSVRKRMRSELGWSNKNIAIHISNFSPIKNINFLVPVIKKITEIDDAFRFLFVGDGPTREGVERELYKNGLGDFVNFTGRSREVHKYLNAADVLLLPSIKEGLPVTVVEAQAAGLKCLVSDSVTKEVDVGNTVFLPLESSKWVDYLRTFKPEGENKRIENCKKFEDSSFNICNEAKRVEQLYLEMG